MSSRCRGRGVSSDAESVDESEGWVTPAPAESRGERLGARGAETAAAAAAYELAEGRGRQNAASDQEEAQRRAERAAALAHLESCQRQAPLSWRRRWHPPSSEPIAVLRDPQDKSRCRLIFFKTQWPIQPASSAS